MRILIINSKALAATISLFFLGFLSMTAQTYTLDNSNSEVTIFGTSNIHDWEIVVEEQKGSLTLKQNSPVTLTAMKISIPVKGLKSGKSGMDKNTYKAMNADDYAEVTFTLTSPATLSEAGSGIYKVKATGNLTISGVTKATDLVFTLKKTASGVILSGEKTLDMTTFDIEPPSALMGTIKTGKEVTLKFNTTLQ
ncbi:YceI family protein [Robertkochia marina]|uniref:YceI family protein n=1 Tax=Robertkochia marina TaxID=1227945 RepID=A0A4S3M4S9_9FLAO|nr:YceI family protein [Robertkochia marina]THD69197.1 YceI family protein [Robertkochia marina]TRZ47544.1 YceI family protein [Robertkochia marina]